MFAKVLRWAVLLAVCVVSTAIALPFYRAASAFIYAPAASSIVVEPSVVFLSVPPADETGELRKQEFRVTLRNVSAKEVKVVGVQSSCGCLASPSQFPLDLQPDGGQQVVFTVQVPRGTAANSKIANAVFYLNEKSGPVELSVKTASLK